MVKIVGKCSLFFLCFFISSYASITLHVTDMQRHALKEVQVGEPFLLTIGTNDDAADREPRIEGLHDLYVKRVGTRLLNINGKKSQEHTYQIRIDKQGSYTLGPAVDPVTGERSLTMRIKAVASSVQSKAPESRAPVNRQSAGVLLRLATDKENVYVGQRIKTILQFFAPESEQLSIEQVTAQDPVTISVSEKIGPKKGIQEIDGKKYAYWQWQWDMFAEEPGQLVIPSYVLDYAKHLPMDNYLGSWASFFGPQYEHKRVYSNAVTLQVKSLPSYDKQVNAVGSFIRYTAQIQPAIAQQYEGMVLTLILEGSGNIDQIQAPELQLPDAFKWYASKQYVRHVSGDTYQKVFEYIVQALQPGDWEIPEQAFTFFDVEVVAYKELKTAPLLVTIIEGRSPELITYEQSPVICKQEANSCQSLLLLQNNKVSDASGPMSLYIFILLLLLPLCIGLAIKGREIMYAFVLYYFPAYAHYCAYKQAQKEISDACELLQAYKLYEIYVRYVAAMTGRVTTSLTTADIIGLFECSSFEQQKKDAAKLFFNEITEIAYAGEKKEVAYGACSNAMEWLHELERLLR